MSSVKRQDLAEIRSIIYKITNTVNGKAYIGQTIRTFYERYRIKWWNRIENQPLERAVKKYGVDNFCIEILEHGKSQEELDRLEIFYIDRFNTLSPKGYNLHSGGRNHIPANAVIKRQRKTIEKKSKEHILVKDGQQFVFKNISQFAQENGLRSSTLCALLKGIFRCYKGFHLPETDVRFKRSTDQVRILEKDERLYEVYNIQRFSEEHSLNKDCVSKLFRNEIREHKGFHLPDLKPKAPRKPMRPKKFSKIILKNGDNLLEIPNERRFAFLKENKIDLYSLLMRRRKISKGYSLYKVYDANGTEINLNEQG